MNVTDEQLATLRNLSKSPALHPYQAEAFDAAIAALAHAAWQEAVAYRWMRNGEPVSEWRNGKPSEREVECARELIGHADWQPQFAYLTPAQPPASAEVGRDAERLDWIERAVTEKCAVWMLTAADQRFVQVRWSRGDVENSPIAPTVREAIDAAIAASSEGQGGS